MVELTPFDRNYLALALHLDRHVPGYVDAYIGPPEIKIGVETAEKKTPTALREDLNWLQDNIPTAEPQRQRYLEATLRAVEGTLRLLAGESMGYLEEVAWLYDVRPQLVDETHFKEAHAHLDSLLPGEGSVAERMQAWREHYELDTGRLLPLLELARLVTRERTAALVALVPGEDMEVQLTSNQPWGAYNWFLGNAQSLIEFNTDVPVNALNILSTFAHEGYPGHHTEHQLKERHLYQEQGYGEQAVFLLHSPAAVIAEGIATTAIEMIFPGDEAQQWTHDTLLPAAGIEPLQSAAELAALRDALHALRYVSGNAALLHHTGRLDREETIDYIMSYGLTSRARAEKGCEFITNPLFRSYIFTYTQGYDLIAHAAGEDKAGLFQKLLQGQILPSQLA